MADAESSQGPRRSQRTKKIVKPFVSVRNTPSKRKRDDSDTEADVHGLNDAEDNTSTEGDEQEEEEYSVPKSGPTGSPNGQSKTKPKPSSPTKATSKAKAPTKTPKTITRKRRKDKQGQDTFDIAKVASETKIDGNNAIFNAIMNPSAALQSIAEDFLDSLSQTPGPAQAELINCVLRACGCNNSVNEDEVLDYDGVLDALDNFTENLKQDDSPVYPLTSKLPAFKKFRKSLSEFIERLILSAAELGSLYTTDLMATLQTWVITMSSSQIRSFRHTATVIALEMETALCEVAASVEKEALVVGRQKAGEKKRKTASKGSVGARERGLEAKAKEIQDHSEKCSEWLNEFVDSVFVHRYRDLDPNIRAECVQSLGFWFKKFPSHFLDTSFLRYVGWVLSDSNTQVRLEAVKALAGVYDQADHIDSLNLFTERFKPRLIEMARRDIELGVRVAVVQVLGRIDQHSMLEDEEREKLCLLLFDGESKVRKAISGFVRSVWEDLVNERLSERKVDEKVEERTGMKALGILLVKWGNILETTGDEESEDQREDNARRQKSQAELGALITQGRKGRTALTVEALWDEIETVSNWEGLLDMLLLDHSAAEEGGVKRPVHVNGRSKTVDNGLDEAWRLDEAEESVLLEVLVASLQRANADAVVSKKVQENNTVSDVTRALIDGLPRLFIKHQPDPNRIATVLLIPPLLNLDIYVEMRMISAYANLWNDVIKQFLTHSSIAVLDNAVACFRRFMEATSLSNTNSTKILELEDDLSSSLRDIIAGRDEIEVASFSEDEVVALGSICSRLAVLAGSRDMTNWMEESEGGKQSSAWDIVFALVERGRLGYKEEECMIDRALNLLHLHLIWKAKGLTTASDLSPEEIRHRETLIEQRDSLVEKLVEYAVGTQSNTAEGVKRSAFRILLNLHVLFCSTQATAADGSPLPTASFALNLDDEVQYRCAGYVQAEIERYIEENNLHSPPSDHEEGDTDDEGEDENANARPQKATKHRKATKADGGATTRGRLEQEYSFLDVIATFLRAIRAGAVHVRHCAVLLAHYGHLGQTFDGCSKLIIDILRDEGIHNNNGELVVNVATQAIRESFSIFLENSFIDESRTLALAKLLSSSFVVRGPQLSIIRRLDSQFIIQIHTALLTWIGKRLAVYEANKNKKSIKRAVQFFRALAPLLVGVDNRDALKIKAHMDQMLALAKVEISPTSKLWDPQRAYEKKLGTTSKDKTTRKKAKSTKVTTDSSGEESEVERLMDEEPESRAQPRRRSARIAKSDGSLTGSEDVVPEAKNPTPKSRPRPRVAYKTSPSHKSLGEAVIESPLMEPMDGATTPVSSRKRLHPGDEELLIESHDTVAGAQDENDTIETDLQIRKRVRR